MKLLLKILAGLVLLVGVCAGGFVSFIELRGIPKYDAPTISEFKVESTPEQIVVG